MLPLVPNDGSVLDIGVDMGNGYIRHLHAKATGGLCVLDAHEPYFQAIKWPSDTVRIVGVAPQVLLILRDSAFSVAFAIDVPEHLVAIEAWTMISELKRVADRVVLFVPEGPAPQSQDIYGMGGDHWQTHRSTWIWDGHSLGILSSWDLPAQRLNGFKVERAVNFHGEGKHALFCVWNRP
jgi:hypothetical protein